MLFRSFVSTAADGVPIFGVTRVGLVDRTTFPLPVLVVTPVPPLATGRVPVTPVVSGRPVAFVSTAAEGVPKAGVVSEGDVERTSDPDPVVELGMVVPPYVNVPLIDRFPTLFSASLMFVLSPYTILFCPLGTEIPVPADVFTVTAYPPVVLL